MSRTGCPVPGTWTGTKAVGPLVVSDCESGPLEIEYGMTFEVREQGVTASGYDYYDFLARSGMKPTRTRNCPRRTRTRTRTRPRREALYELTEPFESREEYSSRGGYPFFVQNDPREEFKSYAATGELC